MSDYPKLPNAQRIKLMMLNDEHGTTGLARLLCVAPATLARAAAGFPIGRATVSHLTMQLSHMDDNSERAADERSTDR